MTITSKHRNSSHFSSFFTFRHHNNHSCTLLPDHPPEIRNRFTDRTLSSDVCVLAPKKTSSLQIHTLAALAYFMTIVCSCASSHWPNIFLTEVILFDIRDEHNQSVLYKRTNNLWSRNENIEGALTFKGQNVK